MAFVPPVLTIPRPDIVLNKPDEAQRVRDFPLRRRPGHYGRPGRRTGPVSRIIYLVDRPEVDLFQDCGNNI